jgi:opacity protein-like surface antigen
MKKILVIALATLLLATPAFAGDYDIVLDLGPGQQTLFNDFVKEVGTLTAYRGLAPAEPQGVTGFDVGVAASFVEIDSDLWTAVMDANLTDFQSEDYLLVPTLRARKGLAFGLDVGASYAQVPDSNIELLGVELQWSLLEGSVATPALSLRGSWSSLEGVDDLEVTTYGADVLISKGFAMFTPYAGIGQVWIDSETNTGLEDESLTKNKYFLGINFNLGLMNFAAETEQTGDNTSTSAKIGVRF